MATKRFQPSLTEIPEEKPPSETYQTRQPPSRRESLISSRNETPHKSLCSGCSDCQSRVSDQYGTITNATGTNCRNCGDKQKSIQKWLESVSTDHEPLMRTDDHNQQENLYSEKQSHEKSIKDTYEKIKPELKSKPTCISSKSISSKKSESSNSDAETVKAASFINNKNRTIRTPSNSNPPSREDSLPKIISYCPKPNIVLPENHDFQYAIRVKTSIENSSLNQNKSTDSIKSNLSSNNNKNEDLYTIDKAEYMSLIGSSRVSTIRGNIKDVPTKEDAIYAYATNKSKRALSISTNNTLRSPVKKKIELYGSLGTGSEIYNNPKFEEKIINKPPPLPTTAPKITNSRFLYEKNNNTKPKTIPHEFINQINKMPDMVYEAMASDYSRNQKYFDGSPSPQLPTPDYNNDGESLCGTYKRIHRRLQRSMTQSSNDEHPQVPTPDYNTLGRRTPKKLYAPDSPTFSRKSPYSLIVDYETDSLERGAALDKSRKSATPPSQNSDASQVSPSLSSALPLEEELEIRNPTYDQTQGFLKEADGKNILLKHEKIPKIKYNTPFMGSMTIEVEHSPDEFDLSTDSDQFEPDTLDRKARKHKNMLKNTINNKPAKYFGHDDATKSMTSLPDMSDLCKATFADIPPQDLYKPGRRNSIACQEKVSIEKIELHRSFESLRGIYEEKCKRPTQIHINKDIIVAKKEGKSEGKLLTLEHRHSKRQRQLDPMKILDKTLAPPDLIPSDKSSGSKIQGFVKAFNSKDHTSWANKYEKAKSKSGCKYIQQVNTDETYDSASVHSEATDFTGVSEQANSEFESKKVDNKKSGIREIIGHSNLGFIRNEDDNNLKSTEESMKFTLLEDYLSLGMSNQSFIDHVNKKLNAYKNNKSSLEKVHGIKTDFENKGSQDLDKIEVISTKTLSNSSSLTKPNLDQINRKSPKRSSYKEFDEAINNLPTTTKVFRAEIAPVTNGMQIAIGLRERVKKNKEIKNAWRRFIDMATSKFKGEKINDDADDTDKKILDEIIDKDDGIGSLLEENAVISSPKPYVNSLEKVKCSNSSVSVSRSNSSRMSSRETDGGYMSADSSESKIHNKRLYERFNFQNSKVNRINEEPAYAKCEVDDEYEKPRPKLQAKDISPPITLNPPKKISTLTKQSIYLLSPPSRPPPPPPIPKATKTSPKKLHSKSIQGRQVIEQLKDVINVNNYSSEEEEGCVVERYSNDCCASSESDDELGLDDDACESGAESIETHSVFFKNIKNANETPSSSSKHRK